MLQNCEYDKIKILHQLSSILWFIEHHAKSDAKNAGDKECQDVLDKLAKDLQGHIKQLSESLHSKC